MITLLSIAFEVLLASSIVPKVIPPWPLVGITAIESQIQYQLFIYVHQNLLCPYIFLLSICVAIINEC